MSATLDIPLSQRSNSVYPCSLVSSTIFFKALDIFATTLSGLVMFFKHSEPAIYSQRIDSIARSRFQAVYNRTCTKIYRDVSQKQYGLNVMILENARR